MRPNLPPSPAGILENFRESPANPSAFSRLRADGKHRIIKDGIANSLKSFYSDGFDDTTMSDGRPDNSLASRHRTNL